MKITLVISSLGPGGAERVITNMANYWAARGQEIDLITLSTSETDFYTLDPSVKRITLGLLSDSSTIFQALFANFLRLQKLRSAIQETHSVVVISFIEKMNIMVLIATAGLHKKVIITERSDPAMHQIGRIWSFLRRVTYPQAASIVVLSEAIRNWIRRETGCDSIVIPNPVSLKPSSAANENLHRMLGLPPGAHLVCSMGRVDRFKGFDLLLKAWQSVQANFPAWYLIIIGDGEARAEMELLSRQLGLQNKVFFLGLVKEPAAWLMQSDLFVLASRYEGFPNVLLEAMACGLPVISTNCAASIPEIVREGVDGLIVPVEDASALASAMDQIMRDDLRRLNMSAQAKGILDRYGIDKVMAMWDGIINRQRTNDRFVSN